MIMFDRRILGNIDWSFLLLLVVFSFIGLLNLYSASYQTDINIFKKQLIWIVLGTPGWDGWRAGRRRPASIRARLVR